MNLSHDELVVWQHYREAVKSRVWCCVLGRNGSLTPSCVQLSFLLDCHDMIALLHHVFLPQWADTLSPNKSFLFEIFQLSNFCLTNVATVDDNIVLCTENLLRIYIYPHLPGGWSCGSKLRPLCLGVLGKLYLQTKRHHHVFPLYVYTKKVSAQCGYANQLDCSNYFIMYVWIKALTYILY